MPRWICPHCTHLSTVDPIVVGHEFSCPACKVESTVIDADAEAISRLKSEKAASEAASHGLRSVTASTVILALATVLSLAASVLMIANRAIGPGLSTIFMTVVGICVISPLLEAINEIHRCRKLLEELVKKR